MSDQIQTKDTGSSTDHWAIEADQLVYCLWLHNTADATAVVDYLTYTMKRQRKSFVWAYIYNYNIIIKNTNNSNNQEEW